MASRAKGQEEDIFEAGEFECKRDSTRVVGRETAIAVLVPMMALSQQADDRDGDGIPDSTDLCPFYSTSSQSDSDGNGIGDECECGNQTGDGLVTSDDIAAINEVIFERQQASPLCDTNDDGQCNIKDILGVRAKMAGTPAYCARYPAP